jgi:hypothetical protein
MGGFSTPSGGGAGGVPSNTVVNETTFGQASNAGAAAPYSRGDHTHGTPTLDPAAAVVTEITFGQAQNVGISAKYAREDHTHGTPNNPSPSSSGTVASETTYGQASNPGAAATFSRGDHTHGTPSVPALSQLSDVIIAGPVVDEILKFNGANWVNGAQAVTGAGAGVMFFLDSTKIIPAGVGPQTKSLETLLKAPSTGGEVDESQTVNNNTILIDQYMYDTALGVTQIDGGEWEFDTYTYVDDATNTSEVIASAGRVFVGAGTIEITGAGTARTATVTGGTPFVAGDFNADITQCASILTPNAVLVVSGFTDDHTVSVTCLATYTNEAGVAYSVDRYMFQVTTGDINALAVSLFSTLTVQPAFVTNLTDKILIKYFAKTDNVGDITVHLVHNGTTNYTHIHTPLATKHNDLAGLQGGVANEYYHLTSAEYTGTGAGNFVRTTNPTITNPAIVLDPTPAVDLTVSGEYFPDTVGENVVFGDILYVKNDGKWWKTDASTAATMPVAAMAMASILANNSGNLLLKGFARNDAWAWTVGGILYADIVAGTITQTAPSAAGEQVQILGVAKSTTEILFNPMYNIVELV